MKRLRQRQRAVALLLLLLCLIAPRDAVAQAGTGTLTGRIVDAQGASIPGALVTVTEEATGAVRTTTSDVEGGFRLSGLPAGRYTVEVTLGGFAPLKVTEVPLAPAEVRGLENLQLKVGQLDGDGDGHRGDGRRADRDEFAHGNGHRRAVDEYSDEGARRLGPAGGHSRRAGHQHEPELHDLDVDGDHHHQRLAQHVEGRRH